MAGATSSGLNSVKRGSPEQSSSGFIAYLFNRLTGITAPCPLTVEHIDARNSTDKWSSPDDFSRARLMQGGADSVRGLKVASV